MFGQKMTIHTVHFKSRQFYYSPGKISKRLPPGKKFEQKQNCVHCARYNGTFEKCLNPKYACIKT